MKNRKVILGLIIGLSLIALLIDLPKVPVVIHNKFINIDTSVGGYIFSFDGGKSVINLSEIKSGLDIQGGVRVTLRADMSKIASADRDSALESAKEVIARRVDLLGVSEPLIQTSKSGGDYRIIVEMPGISNVSEALSAIGQTAQLTFKTLKPDVKYDSASLQQYFFDRNVWQDSGITGADLKGADVIFGSSNTSAAQGPQIRLRFTDEGRTKFAKLAKANINKPVGIFLDQATPISMPVVNPDLASGLTGDPVITGSFSVEEANRLSISIRAGALPVPVEIIEQNTVGAVLGRDSIRKSVIAGLVGILIVGVFMIVSYGKLGVLADIALLIYGLITFALFKLIPVTMTVPGIAGFILSIGMAVDANILTFERIHEEISWGKPFNLALKLGFERAWPSIRDSNASSLMTSAILFYLGTGIVKGFALTLAVGIGVSMFTALFVTQTLISVFYHGEDRGAKI